MLDTGPAERAAGHPAAQAIDARRRGVRVIGEIELAAPLLDIPPASALIGEKYRRAQAVVRLHTQPLGLVELEVTENGQRAEAEKLARDLDARAGKAIAEGKWIGPVVMVPAYLALGDKDKAMTYLERSNDERHGRRDPCHCLGHPDLRRLVHKFVDGRGGEVL